MFTEESINSRTRGGDPLEKIDLWLQDLVPDIVRNLKQAPLLVQIYSRLDGKVRIETEKAVPEVWPAAREGWRSGESKSLCQLD
ncbi:hypothetical protein SASPL_114776 [Salvia splendens]|uniref:DUF7804 domain-containing protein n=1 Tax=Salvia splendens TaxID=180675 RepID=A0A8X8Y4C4_SALSN|nr:hypothetical protein SASPL_114776 [Salvia splendens]